MKTIKFFAAALAIVAAASCSKEPISNDNSDNTEPVLVHKVFTASLETDSDPDSKTTLHTDGKSVHWTAGDQIKVIASNTYDGSTFSIIENSIANDFAAFEGSTIDADSYRAVYPAAVHSSNSPNGNTFLLSTAPSFGDAGVSLNTQYAVDNNFSIAANWNVPSNFAVSVSSKNEHLYFQNINAYLKFSLDVDDAYQVVISSSSVTAGSGQSSSYDLGSAINFFPNTFKDGGEGSIKLSGTNAEITFKYEDGSPLKKGVPYYIAIPAVTIDGLRVSVQDKEGHELFANSKRSSFSAESNTIYNLGPLTKPLPAVGDYYYSDGTFGPELTASTVGIIFYVGDPTKDDGYLGKDYPKCTNGLVMDLHDEWSYRASPEADFEKIIEWKVPYGYVSVLPINHNNNQNNLSIGYSLTKTVKKYSQDNSALIASTGHELVVLELNAKPIVPGTSGWYVPSCGEYAKMHSAISTLDQLGVNHSLSLSRYYSTFWVSSTGLYDGTLDGNHWGFRIWDASGNEEGEYWRYIFAF